MANRHFGKLSDVWKHAALAEVLEREPPRRYAETHAGSGAYPVAHDGERQFGILRFLDVAARFEVLARSRYRAIAASWLNGRGLYPGSALLAMTVLGDASSYLLCDLDPGSAADLRRWARQLSLRDYEVAETDGMAAVAAWLDRHAGQPGLVHIDPFDPDARGPGGYSAAELAVRVASSGTGLVYWYGYGQPGEQAWAYTRLTALTRAPLWCGDVMVTGTSGTAGDLGRATTPGTGFGVILANVQAGTVSACTAVGNALADAYAGALLPDGSRAISSSQPEPTAGRHERAVSGERRNATRTGPFCAHPPHWTRHPQAAHIRQVAARDPAIQESVTLRDDRHIRRESAGCRWPCTATSLKHLPTRLG